MFRISLNKTCHQNYALHRRLPARCNLHLFNLYLANNVTWMRCDNRLYAVISLQLPKASVSEQLDLSMLTVQMDLI